MLTNEFMHYQPTIACMQEVDLEQYSPYFVPLFESLGYDHAFLVGKKKRHGILIAWKRGRFELTDRRDIHFGLLSASGIGPCMYTGNVGLALGLKNVGGQGGLWISTTHLYWHPRGSYERQRQAGILVFQTQELALSNPDWPVIVCGGTLDPFCLFVEGVEKRF
jgi:RNA exonuclease NGL2